jgi:hypothetical protein
MLEQLVRVRAHTAAVERGKYAGRAAELRIMNGRIRLVSVEMQRAAARKIEMRKRVQVLRVAAAHDGALAVLRHYEGKRGRADMT